MLGTHLLLLAATLFTSNAQAMTCGNNFDDIVVSSEVTSWGERIQRSLDALKIDSKNLNILQDAKLDVAKLQFLEVQKPHLEPLLKSGKITYKDLGIFKPIIVWESGKPETKYYFLMTSSGPYLFSLDGARAPINPSARSGIGFLQESAITKLESDVSRFTVLEDGIRFEPKNPATENVQAKATLDGKKDVSQPALFSSPNTNHYLQAVRKRFPEQIRQLLNENKITEADLQLTNFAVSTYSEAAFAVIPNASRSDFYFISLTTGSYTLASKMSTGEHGSHYQYSNGNKLELKQGIGFLPNNKISTNFNQIFSDALVTIQRQIEFVVGRQMTTQEAQAVADSMAFVAKNDVNLNDLNVMKVFLEPYNAIGAFEVANVAITRAKELKAAANEASIRQQ